MYTAFTVEAGANDGSYPDRTDGMLNDTQFDVAPDGSYEIILGGESQDRNWLGLRPMPVALPAATTSSGRPLLPAPMSTYR
ncbi:MAG: hypothetical protein Ct9H300mP12_02170 [Acidimicrobiales bacterium]|nr:MAG: hypothetical protein Ct9H300mP12_02170 [Acidimicrobiales bacterium]